MNMKMEIGQNNEEIVVKVYGEIDVYTAPKLRETLFSLTEQRRVDLTIDLSGVAYMDSTGLGVFVGTFKQVRANEGAFRLIGLSDRLKRLFKITGLAEIMQIASMNEGEEK